MKAEKRTVGLEIEVGTITCPKCNSMFVVHYVWDGGLISQVPDSGTPFFCPYCGVDVNKSKKLNHDKKRIK